LARLFKFGSLVLLLVAGLAVLIAAPLRVVVRAAEDIAGSQPYCIQIADGVSDYRPARSWLDLSAFTMRATQDSRSGLSLQHHAILVVGKPEEQRLYHWSYGRGTFDPGVFNDRFGGRGDPVVSCEPETGFAAKRLAFNPKPSGSDYVSFSARDTYRIPKVWQARWSGGAGRSLSLVTSAPEFQPLDRRWNDLPPNERESNWVFVEWNPEWVSSLMKSRSANSTIEETDFGLSKHTTIFRGKDGRKYVGVHYLAYADDAGINTTIISCNPPTEKFPASCQHRFINKGRHFDFCHGPENLAQWRAMQQRILRLMDSFEVRDGLDGADGSRRRDYPYPQTPLAPD